MQIFEVILFFELPTTIQQKTVKPTYLLSACNSQPFFLPDPCFSSGYSAKESEVPNLTQYLDGHEFSSTVSGSGMGGDESRPEDFIGLTEKRCHHQLPAVVMLPSTSQNPV